jgi:hypothetical protein
MDLDFVNEDRSNGLKSTSESADRGHPLGAHRGMNALS